MSVYVYVLMCIYLCIYVFVNVFVVFYVTYLQNRINIMVKTTSGIHNES